MVCGQGPKRSCKCVSAWRFAGTDGSKGSCLRTCQSANSGPHPDRNGFLLTSARATRQPVAARPRTARTRSTENRHGKLAASSKTITFPFLLLPQSAATVECTLHRCCRQGSCQASRRGPQTDCRRIAAARQLHAYFPASSIVSKWFENGASRNSRAQGCQRLVCSTLLHPFGCGDASERLPGHLQCTVFILETSSDFQDVVRTIEKELLP